MMSRVLVCVFAILSVATMASATNSCTVTLYTDSACSTGSQTTTVSGGAGNTTSANGLSASLYYGGCSTVSGLPTSFNASYGTVTWASSTGTYNGQNYNTAIWAVFYYGGDPSCDTSSNTTNSNQWLEITGSSSTTTTPCGTTGYNRGQFSIYNSAKVVCSVSGASAVIPSFALIALLAIVSRLF